MTDFNEKYRNFVIESIKLYRSLPALWDVKAKDYRDKAKKNQAYDIMVEKFHEMYPDANRETVKKKFNILRTNYRKELKKLQQRGRDFTSTLWYFNELTFLNSSLNMEADCSEASRDSAPEDEKLDFHVHYSPRNVQERVTKYETEDSFESSSLPPPAPEPPRNIFQEGEFQAVGFNVSAKLQKMSTEQQIYAELLLNKVLTRGLLGTLTSKTDLTNY